MNITGPLAAMLRDINNGRRVLAATSKPSGDIMFSWVTLNKDCTAEGRQLWEMGLVVPVDPVGFSASAGIGVIKLSPAGLAAIGLDH